MSRPPRCIRTSDEPRPVRIHVYPKRGPRTTEDDDHRFLRTARAVVVARHFHSGRVCRRRCCDGCAPFTGPVVSGRRVNWFTEKTISALAYFKHTATHTQRRRRRGECRPAYWTAAVWIYRSKPNSVVWYRPPADHTLRARRGFWRINRRRPSSPIGRPILAIVSMGGGATFHIDSGNIIVYNFGDQYFAGKYRSP